MLRYVLRRLVAAVPTMLVIITLAFALLHAAPGGPFDEGKEMMPEIRASIEKTYHLDEPVPLQYLRYLAQIARGDLGPSFQYRNTSVNELIAQGLPIDLTIGGLALLVALLVGLPLGVLAATQRGRWLDHLSMGISLLGISVPVLVIAPLLILVFAVTLQWLPAGDWADGNPRNLVLPVLALSAPYIAYVARITRGSLVEVLQAPYIRTARAKGLPAHIILLRHAMKPTLLPLVSFLGPASIGVITGSIVIESVFGLPGIGRFFVNGAFNRDYTLVMGVTILYGGLIVLANLLADLCYAWLDPRVRLS
ncbi:MAG TPA: oligopeptide ABC transporter permease OppB [Steroidobacteraceae bacterium]|jgi:oligopeptide transport system permease protein|nr:oligopeptide ABC transporter permease OppB [Steroidobacteraceae bacterium]